MLTRLGLRQPDNGTATSAEEAEAVAIAIGYPVVIRPSYVLGGRAMEIVHDAAGLNRYMRHAVSVSGTSPVLIDRYLQDAIEVDVDAVADGRHVEVAGIMEHIEEAGIHSGDSACSLPPYSLDAAAIAEIERQTVALARALGVVGLMNVQFAVKDGDVYVLEVNPRASRTVPFVAKATGVPIAKIAARVMAGEQLGDFRRPLAAKPRTCRGQGGGVSVRPLPRGRSDPRPGDEIDRRGHGARRRFRPRLRQVAARQRHAIAARGLRFRLGARPRQGRADRAVPAARRNGVHLVATRARPRPCRAPACR